MKHLKDIKDWTEMKNTVVVGDCLSGMKLIPDKSIDLVLTDPPYNVKINYDKHKDAMSPEKYIEFIDEIISMSDRIANGKIAALLGSKTEILLNWWKRLPNANLVICRVGASVNTQVGGFRPQYRPILINMKSLKWWSNLWEDIRFPGEGYFFNEPRYDHPCIMPLKLAEKCIECLTEPGDLVCDPFMGSWTTARACKNLGRDFIGFEISEKYCKVGEERLRQEVMF